jgi:hypothetical protein
MHIIIGMCQLLKISLNCGLISHVVTFSRLGLLYVIFIVAEVCKMCFMELHQTFSQ